MQLQPQVPAVLSKIDSMKKKVFYLICCIILSALLGCSVDKPGRSVSNIHDFAYQEMTIGQIQNGYQKGHFTIEDVVVGYIDRINAVDKNGAKLNSVIIVNPDAVKIARELDQEFADGNIRGPMHGIPVLLKDNIDTHDKMPTTAGSRALINSFPLKDSWVAAKLREAGAVILGKTNLSEWANFRGRLSSSGWSGIGGQTKNPYMLDRNPCGSSSGSGVAVSANFTVVAIGTETNGSIVCPSTANGIVGIKPTVGLISRAGIIPISFTQDTPGPMARTVRDAAICLGVLAGTDVADEKTKDNADKIYQDYTQFLKPDGIKGKRIGFYKKPLGEHYKTDAVMQQAIDFFKEQGAEIIEIEKIYEQSARSNSFQVMLFEYKDGLNKYFAGLGENAPVKNLDELIEFNENDPHELKYYDQEYLKMANDMEGLDSKDYQDALKNMFEETRENGIDRVMDEHKLDAIVSPTGSPAWKTDWINGDAFVLSSSSPAAMSGYPNITVPMGSVDGLPVGISIFGREWSEPVLLEIAYAYEQGTKHRRVPMFLAN